MLRYLLVQTANVHHQLVEPILSQTPLVTLFANDGRYGSNLEIDVLTCCLIVRIAV